MDVDVSRTRARPFASLRRRRRKNFLLKIFFFWLTPSSPSAQKEKKKKVPRKKKKRKNARLRPETKSGDRQKTSGPDHALHSRHVKTPSPSSSHTLPLGQRPHPLCETARRNPQESCPAIARQVGQ